MRKRDFTQFYEEHVEKIYKFVFFRVAANKELAQDLTQDIFFKAFEAFEAYDPAKSHVGWIYTIARNCLIDHHNRKRPNCTLEEVEGTMLAATDPRERFVERHDHAKLMEAILSLSADDGRLVRMKYLEGWSFEDLEEIFEKKSGALRVQARRAIKKLAPLLKK